jgi:hypothetical protein
VPACGAGLVQMRGSGYAHPFLGIEK